MMKYYKLVALTLLLTGATVAEPAMAALEVEFAATPLFNEAKIVPGDGVTRTVVVKNTGEVVEQVEVLVENFFTGSLADALSLQIVTDEQTYFSDSLSNFFTRGRVPLGELQAGETQTYRFVVDFPSLSGNELMSTKTGFDLIIGFVGGEQVSDNPEVTGSSGGSGGSPRLRLFNEAVETLFIASSTALIRWNSNVPATSYLVCGNTSAGKDFILSTTPPLFGYEFFVTENSNRTQNHTLLVTGTSDSSYECRPAGRRTEAGEFTVGQPVTFVFPGSRVLGVATTTGIYPLQSELIIEDESRPEGEVLGDQIALWPKGGLALGFGREYWLEFLGFLLSGGVVALLLWRRRQNSRRV